MKTYKITYKVEKIIILEAKSAKKALEKVIHGEGEADEGSRVSNYKIKVNK